MSNPADGVSPEFEIYRKLSENGVPMPAPISATDLRRLETFERTEMQMLRARMGK